VIFQDTLERDFGSDPDLLARQVDRTLRHAVAHHLGYNEPGSPRSASEADRAVARRGVEAWLRGVKVAYIFSTSGAMTRPSIAHVAVVRARPESFGRSPLRTSEPVTAPERA
jgi:hypothetical protein